MTNFKIKCTAAALMIVLVLMGFILFTHTASAQTNNNAAGAASNAAAGSQSASVAISGGGGGGGGGVGAANFSVDPQVTITSSGSDLGKSVPTAIPPALTTTLSETCSSSATGAIAVSGFGFSGGKTYSDQDCVARLNARELRSMGMNAEAMEVLCSRPTIYSAMNRMAKRKRSLSVCSGMNPEAKDYDSMALSSELTAAGGYDPEDDVYSNGKIVGRWDYKRDGQRYEDDYAED